MKYQIGYWRRCHPHEQQGTFIYVEPSTYYPSKEAAAGEIPRIEKQLPSLAGVLEVREPAR